MSADEVRTIEPIFHPPQDDVGHDGLYQSSFDAESWDQALPDPVMHRVRKGESIASIAAAYYPGNERAGVALLSGGRRSLTIHPGEAISIPALADYSPEAIAGLSRQGGKIIAADQKARDAVTAEKAGMAASMNRSDSLSNYLSNHTTLLADEAGYNNLIGEMNYPSRNYGGKTSRLSSCDPSYNAECSFVQFSNNLSNDPVASSWVRMVGGGLGTVVGGLTAIENPVIGLAISAYSADQAYAGYRGLKTYYRTDVPIVSNSWLHQGLDYAVGPATAAFGEIALGQLLIPLTGYAAVKGSGVTPSTGGKTTAYRVEGTPNQRLMINEFGEVSLVSSNNTILWINFGQEGRAVQYLQMKMDKNLPGAQLKSFDVEQSFLNRIRSDAVPEGFARQYPNRPIISADPYPDQFGLPKNYFGELMKSIHQGTGRNGP